MEGRLDPIYYCAELFGFLKTTKFRVRRIKQIALSLKSGFGAGKQDQEQHESGIIHIRPTNIGNEGNLKFDKNVYLPVSLLESEQDIFLQKGDVLFNNTNSQELVGKTAYFTEEGNFLFSNHITRVRVNENEILPQFLVLLFNTFHRRKIFYSICTNWNNQSGVGIDLLGSLKIPVPPLEIQTQIIERSEAAYHAKRSKEEEAKNLLDSIDAYLLELLGIETPAATDTKKTFFTRASKLSSSRFDPFYHKTEFEELEKSLQRIRSIRFSLAIEIITKGETPLWKGESYTDTGIPFLRVQNIEIDGIKSDLIFISEDLHSQMKRSQLSGGEILYTMAGSIGVATILPNDFGEANINQAIAKIVLKSNFEKNKSFIVEMLNSSLCKRQAERFLTVSAQPNINFEQIKSILIPFPPLKIQEEIAAHIQSIRDRAKDLEHEAQAEVERAKAEVEQMILGEVSAGA